MRRSIQDKMVAFIAKRGAAGVSSEDLAKEFLSPASAPANLCERLIGNVLENEGRVTRTSEGMWVVVGRRSDLAKAGGFCVIETCDLAAGSGRLPGEWAAVRVDAQGRTGEACEGVIRLGTRPQGAVLPAHLRGRVEGGRSFADALAEAADFAHGSTVVSVRPGPFQEGVAKALQTEDTPGRQLFLGRLAKQLIGADVRTIEDLAGRLNVPLREPEAAPDRAAFVAELLCAMLSLREKLNFPDPEEWVERQQPKRFDVDFSNYDFDRDFLSSLPERAGVYVMRDANGDVIYVGKARNLRRRVEDYFRARVRRDKKTMRILEAIYAVEVEETGSELAALLAEYRLIRELQPWVNIQYDVHDRLANQRAPSRRWVVVLAAVKPDEAEVFLFYGNRTLRRVVVPRAQPERLRSVLAELFFGSEPPEPEAETELGWLRLAWSWLERHRDCANAFDVELTGGLDGTMRVLANYMREPPSGERVFHVYHAKMGTEPIFAFLDPAAEEFGLEKMALSGMLMLFG